MRIKMISDIDQPGYAHDGDCGLDLRASGRFLVTINEKEEEVASDALTVNPGDRILVRTGIIVEIPKGHWGNIRDRSGLAKNHGIHVLAGVVDENYRGEIGVVLVNLGKKEYVIKKNERIAQMIITPYVKADIVRAEEVSDSVRGGTGYGRSGRF